MTIRFSVTGEPRGKGRPKFSKVGSFVQVRSPEETAVYENLVRMEFNAQCGGVRFAAGEQLAMMVFAFYKIPSSVSKQKKREMLEGIIRPVKKPDLDNILKIVADALNERAYRDDAQIIDAQVRKFYSHQPRVDVMIRTANYPDALQQYKKLFDIPYR
jgi:Holliday junction resolvase RusA-like endonuclease